MAMAIPCRSLNSPITVLAGIACRSACDWGTLLMLLLALAIAAKTCSNRQHYPFEGFCGLLCLCIEHGNPSQSICKQEFNHCKQQQPTGRLS